MTEFLAQYHLTGLAIGIFTFLIIGLFHPICVKAEYYCGVRCWWVFLLAGICGVAASVMIGDIFWSSLLGVFAFSSFWTIKELFEQRERVRKGWFPENPKRQNKIKFASTDKIMVLENIAADFFPRIIGLDFYNCFVSDESSLSDFDLLDEKTMQKINSEYGLELTDLKDGNIVWLLSLIMEKHFPSSVN